MGTTLYPYTIYPYTPYPPISRVPAEKGRSYHLDIILGTALKFRDNFRFAHEHCINSGKIVIFKLIWDAQTDTQKFSGGGRHYCTFLSFMLSDHVLF